MTKIDDTTTEGIPAVLDRIGGKTKEQIATERAALTKKHAKGKVKTPKMGDGSKPMQPKNVEPAGKLLARQIEADKKAKQKERLSALAERIEGKKPKQAKPQKKAASQPQKAVKNGEKKPANKPPASSGRKRYDWVSARERAATGKLPAPPDFSANTHRYYRPKLAELVKLAKAGDSKGLSAYKITGSSSSPTSMKNYRECCLVALRAAKA